MIHWQMAMRMFRKIAGNQEYKARVARPMDAVLKGYLSEEDENAYIRARPNISVQRVDTTSTLLSLKNRSD
jgi:hypothetical protein